MASSSLEEGLTLLLRLLGTAEKMSLLKDVFSMGIEKATSHHFNLFLSNFPSITLAEELLEGGAPTERRALLNSWDYNMPNGEIAVVNIFQDGPYLHINSDRLQPIRYWVVKRLLEDGTILVPLPIRKDKFFTKKYYKAYEILNLDRFKPALCYS